MKKDTSEAIVKALAKEAKLDFVWWTGPGKKAYTLDEAGAKGETIIKRAKAWVRGKRDE